MPTTGSSTSSHGPTKDSILIALLTSASMVGVFVLSIPVALAAPPVAPYTWLVIVPLRLVTRRIVMGWSVSRAEA